MSRGRCQVILFAIWFTFLLVATAIYIAGSARVNDNHNYLIDASGSNSINAKVPDDWQTQMEKRYEAPLAGVYSPWLLVMVGAVLASKDRTDRISIGIFTLTCGLSIAFNVALCFLLYFFLFKSAVLYAEIPANRPLFILLISILGAFVTYNFPSSEK